MPIRIVRDDPVEAARSPSEGRRVKIRASGAPKGSKAVRTAPRGHSEDSGSNGQGPKFKGGLLSTAPSGGLWSLKKGTTQLRFLSEPEPTDECPDEAAINWYSQYFDEGMRHYFILADNEEPPDGQRAQTRWAVAAYDRSDNSKNDQVKIFSLPISLQKDILAQYRAYGTICDADAYIDNEGQGQTGTSYTIRFDRQTNKIKGIEAIRAGINIPAALQAEKKRLDDMPARPVQKKSMRELRAMDLETFRDYCRSLDIPTKGKTRGELVDEIMEAQAD